MFDDLVRFDARHRHTGILDRSSCWRKLQPLTLMRPTRRELNGNLISLLNHPLNGMLQVWERHKKLTHKSCYTFWSFEDFGCKRWITCVPHLFIDSAHQGFVLANSFRHDSHSLGIEIGGPEQSSVSQR